MLPTTRDKVIKLGRGHPYKRHVIGESRIPTEDLSFHTCELLKLINYSAPYLHSTEGPVLIRYRLVKYRIDCRSPS